MSPFLYAFHSTRKPVGLAQHLPYKGTLAQIELSFRSLNNKT